MSYLDEHGLARYDGLIKNWVTFKSGTVDGVDPLLNWQRTGTAGAVSFYPLPAAPVDPVVNFLFTESGPALGTKGPDNPSTITGVSEVNVTRCGKNLIVARSDIATTTINGITFTVNRDGTYTISGTASDSATLILRYQASGVPVKSGVAYTLSGCPSNVAGLSLNVWSPTLGSKADNGSGVTFAPNADMTVNVGIVVLSGTVISSPVVVRPQLELGSTATSFEPYEGADYTVDLNGTFYGGSVDLSAGTMTVTHEVLSFDGTEELWVFGGEVNSSGIFRYCYYPLPRNAPSGIAVEVSSHFDYLYNWNNESEHFYIAGTGCNCFSTKTTLEAFKSWLASQKAAGTPVTFTYPLATPYTVPLTPIQIYSLSQLDPYTPRINTVYSDQTSVQVGYPKSPQASQTELTNAIVSLGGNV